VGGVTLLQKGKQSQTASPFYLISCMLTIVFSDGKLQTEVSEVFVEGQTSKTYALWSFFYPNLGRSDSLVLYVRRKKQ